MKETTKVAVPGASLRLTMAGECRGCKRHSTWPQVSNPHIPEDFDEKNDAWMRCMDENLEYGTFDGDSPDFKAPLETCQQVAPPPEVQDIVDPGSLANRLFELSMHDCFLFGGRHPEYSFVATFEANLGGTETFVHRGSVHQLHSRLSIELWYDGDERELVKRWETKGSLDTIGAPYRRMFTSSDAVMRADVPLKELLWRFERRPVDCQITPEEISVRENETIEINLTRFTGKSGPSKSFNRIVVTVDEGEILNGEPLESDPDARVFKIGNGNVTVEYTAPGSCSIEGDTIHIYSSCDIARTSLVPLSQTKARDEIARKEINCPTSGWTGTATLSRTHQFDCEDTLQEGRSVLTLHQHDRRSEEATMSVRCEDFNFAEKPIVALSAGTDIVVSGTHRRSVDESHFSERSGTGCWSNERITLEGGGSCAVSPDSLSLSFREAAMGSADEMRRLMQEMSETISDDPDRYQELSAQLEALVNPAGGDAGTRLTGIAQYALDCPIDVAYRQASKGKCETDDKVRTSEQGTRLELRGISVIVEFEATYIKGKKGKGSIVATHTKTTPFSPPAPFTSVGKHDCPAMMEALTFNLNLTRQPDQ